MMQVVLNSYFLVFVMINTVNPTQPVLLLINGCLVVFLLAAVNIMDRLGGGSSGGIGESFGSGYPAGVLSKWLKRAVLA